MADRVLSTRRALLRALPLSLLAFVAPAALTPPAARGNPPPLPEPASLAGLIAAHRAAFADYDDASAAVNAACDRIAFLDERVLLFTTSRDGAQHWAYTEEQIDRHVEGRLPDWRGDLGGRDMAAQRAALGGQLKADLQTLRDENTRREMVVNLPALNAQLDAAAARERKARIAVLACRPRDDAEAEIKAEYMASSEPFVDRWINDDIEEVIELIEQLGRTGGK